VALVQEGPREALGEVRHRKFNLNDAGYIAIVHPRLNVWTADLSAANHPLRKRGRSSEASRECAPPRIRGSSKRAITRLRIGASSAWSTEAFAQIGNFVARTGLPFASLTPRKSRPSVRRVPASPRLRNWNSAPLRMTSRHCRRKHRHAGVRERHALRTRFAHGRPKKAARLSCSPDNLDVGFITCCATMCSAGTCQTLADGILCPTAEARLMARPDARPALEMSFARGRCLIVVAQGPTCSTFVFVMAIASSCSV